TSTSRTTSSWSRGSCLLGGPEDEHEIAERRDEVIADAADDPHGHARGEAEADGLEAEGVTALEGPEAVGDEDEAGAAEHPRGRREEGVDEADVGAEEEGADPDVDGAEHPPGEVREEAGREAPLRPDPDLGEEGVDALELLERLRLELDADELEDAAHLDDEVALRLSPDDPREREEPREDERDRGDDHAGRIG